MTTFTHAPNAAALPRALAHIERRLYTLHCEIRLVADLATAGQHANLGGLSLETLATAIHGYADRIEALHDDVEHIAAQAVTSVREVV